MTGRWFQLDPDPTAAEYEVSIPRPRRHPYLLLPASTLAGRLEAVERQRDTLQEHVVRLMDQRDTLVKLLDQISTDRDRWRDACQRAQEGQA
jgi:hypothetical protein